MTFKKVESHEEYLKNKSSVRRSGTTTAIILSGIAEAVKRPGMTVVITDHLSTLPSKLLVARVLDIVSALGLVDMEVKSNGPINSVSVLSTHYGVLP